MLPDRTKPDQTGPDAANDQKTLRLAASLGKTLKMRQEIRSVGSRGNGVIIRAAD